MITIEKSDRLNQLPPYLFKEIDKQKEIVKKQGMDIIDLGVGDPDQPTPGHIIDVLKKEAEKPSNHTYPSYSGSDEFNSAVADWYARRFNVTLDPKTEVITLIGSKEGIAHAPLAFINPGDWALVPRPGYPVYEIGVKFAGGNVHFMDLLRENRFLPVFGDIPAEIAAKAKIMFLNYPNNPTSALADGAFFSEAVEFAEKNNIIVCHDAAYSEMAFDGCRPESFLETKGAKDVGIEFHSLSKTYNMTGWRIGFAVGRAEVIQAIGQIKSNIDSGVFQAIQMAGIAALNGDQSCVDEMNRMYAARRDVLVDGLSSLGLRAEKPKATFYVWIHVPDGYTSAEFATRLLTKAGIVATPGNGFGAPGEGYIRMALTVGEKRLEEAVERIRSIGF